MEFVVNTKPLKDALELGIVKANISNLYLPSSLAQVHATSDKLIINLECRGILTEIILPGSGTAGEESTIFVDCMILKKLVDSFDFQTTILKFVGNSLELYSNSSKFVLPMIIDSEISMDSPRSDYVEFDELDFISENWRFVRDNQACFLDTNFTETVYNYVWCGERGDVIAGDYRESLFSHTTKGGLLNTCLLPSSIVNFLASIPDGASIYDLDDCYVVEVNTDAFKFVSQITPFYESDDDVGSYNADVFLSILVSDDEDHIDINPKLLRRHINQASLVLNSSNSVITMELSGNILKFYGDGVKFEIETEDVYNLDDFKLKFKLAMLKRVISKFDEDMISMCYIEADGEIVGIKLWSYELDIMLAGVD